MTTQVCISFDTTGSMYSCLSEVRTHIVKLTETLFRQIPDLQIAIIAHGDYNDKPYTVTHLDFTSDPVEIRKFVEYVSQTNGFGNGGECYELVMGEYVPSLSWEMGKRAYILIGDEPAHIKGNRISPMYSGNRYQTVVHDWKESARKLTELNIQGFVVRCQNRSDSRAFHNGLAQIFGTNIIPLQQFTNIVPLLTAAILNQEGSDLVEVYQEGLQSAGMMNMNLRAIFNSILNKYDQTSVQHDRDLTAVDPYRFQLLTVPHSQAIKTFVQSNGARFQVGKGFYELTKREEVQEQKEVVLMDADGRMYSGEKARELIGLPYGMRGNVYPQNIGYTVFIQSTSNNRKLVGGTRFLYEQEQY